MDMLKRFAIAWLVMWGLSYIIVGIQCPQIAGGDPYIGALTYEVLGAAILLSIMACLLRTSFLVGGLMVEPARVRSIGHVALFVLGVIMVYGGIVSWAGVAVWNVPFDNKEIFQVSMALANMLSAAFMFLLAFNDDEKP